MTNTNTGGLPEPFGGFEAPHYTQIPDQLFDELLPYLSGAELKALLYIMRRIFGFKKSSDPISLSQMLNGITKKSDDGDVVLDRGTGLSKPTLLGALRGLQDKGLIFTERQRSAGRGDQPTVYRLHMRGMTPGKETLPPLVKKFDQGGGQESSPGGWSRNLTTQETGLQETDEQETDNFEYSKVRKVQPAKQQESISSAEPPASSAPADGSVESLGDVLARRRPPRPADRADALRPETGTEEYQRIQALIAERAREFADAAPLKSSTTRAWNLFQRGDVSIDRFTDLVYQAKALTQEATARIKKTSEDPEYRTRRKNKMAYFFAVLEHLLGLREAVDSTVAAAGETSEPTTRGFTGRSGPSAGTVWRKVRDVLAFQLPRDVFNRWLASSKGWRMSGDQLVVRVADVEAAAFLKDRLQGQVEATAATVIGRPIKVIWEPANLGSVGAGKTGRGV